MTDSGHNIVFMDDCLSIQAHSNMNWITQQLRLVWSVRLIIINTLVFGHPVIRDDFSFGSSRSPSERIVTLH